jgi:hypothetical protein
MNGTNRQSLIEAMDRVAAALERHAGLMPRTVDEQPHDQTQLDILAARFGLTPFERDVIVLAAGVELDAKFSELCGVAQGDPARTEPTFALALAALADAHWTAISPARPLRRWNLVDVEKSGSLTAQPLRIPERVLHFLLGENYLDPQLAAIIERVPPPASDELPESHADVARRMAAVWSGAQSLADLPVIRLGGRSARDNRTVAAHAAATLDLPLYVASAESLPLLPADAAAFARRWERESGLSIAALLIEAGDDGLDPAREGAVARLVDSIDGMVIVSGGGRRGPGRKTVVSFDVPRPTFAERRALWDAALGETAAVLGSGGVDNIAAHFSLHARTVRDVADAASAELRSDPDAASAAKVSQVLWHAARAQSHARLEELARHIPARATLDDLVLPPDVAATLREIAAGHRQRMRVYEDWGFAARSSRGLGMSALFAGPSGTGKTTAAEALARELDLDLFAIDLSAVISKYIGETEKNLRRVFDAAEEGGAVLLFDEADALFGKRTEVRDSHDRYANVEVGYLLQRMESYEGIALLTTNARNSLDSAFLRRLRFIVNFPFPDAAQRREIWRRVFPSQTPTEGLDFAKLAKLNVTGGNIRNIALNAAFLAADESRAVTMDDVLRATRSEYAKSEKTPSEAEVGGWA